MKHPELDVPLIVIETDEGQVVDLHNESDLRCVVRRGDELVFEFDAADGYGSLGTVLYFVGVRDLRILQPEDWHPAEPIRSSTYWSGDRVRGHGSCSKRAGSSTSSTQWSFERW